MGERSKMLCPDCGVEMNCHAEKVDYGAALDGAAEVDPVLGGVVEEFHTCPKCGATHARPAE